MSSVAVSSTPRRWAAALRSLFMGIVAIAGLALFLAWMGGAFHTKVVPGEMPVERQLVGDRAVVKAERATMEESINVVGSVQPRRKTDVASQLMATVREVKVRPGDRVRPGDVLITLDDRELQAQQREASATLAAAEADLTTRKADYERLRASRATGAVTAEELSRVEGAFRVTEAQVRRAKESILRFEVQLSHARIMANGEGIVADRFADPGDLAAPGKPILTIYDPAELELHVNVPEGLASSIAVGQRINARIDANNWGAPVPVREIVPLAQQASRSVMVKLALPQSTSIVILPGMYGRAAIPVGRVERVWLPQLAIRQIGQLDLVDLVETDGTLSRRFVRTGKIVDGKAEVLSGLAPGEVVALPSR